MKLTITGNNKKHLELIEKLAKELGLSISRSTEEKKETEEELEAKERSERLYRLMTEMAESGGLESIKDPIEWQREVREDKKLYGRE